jgi:hypothetical protein
VQLSVRRGEPRRVAASTTTSTQSAPRIAAEPQTVTLPPLGTTAAQFPPSGREKAETSAATARMWRSMETDSC